MPTLENDCLVFRFPQTDKDQKVSIKFKRTLRIPDTDKTYPLPPGLGNFSLRHTDDYANRLPQATVDRGGVIMPIWQAEAMWISFFDYSAGSPYRFPVAIKIAAGKINAVTGESWRSGLNRDPQDYIVAPNQMWLDGFAVEKGVVRQFVAMPLGEGYSAEEQITGEAAWGGLQISVTPLKAALWKILKEEQDRELKNRDPYVCYSLASPEPMGLAAGGKMHQKIYPDHYGPDAWDLEATDRVFVTLLHAKDWKSITGEAPATFPPSAEAYSKAGLPWFDLYGTDQDALEGSEKPAQLKSLAVKFKEKTGVMLPDSSDVETGAPVVISRPTSEGRPVRSADC